MQGEIHNGSYVLNQLLTSTALCSFHAVEHLQAVASQWCRGVTSSCLMALV